MDIEARHCAWWLGLSDEQRALALTVDGPLPPWMVTSLHGAGIIVIEADLAGSSRVCLMSTTLRDFLDGRRHDAVLQTEKTEQTEQTESEHR